MKLGRQFHYYFHVFWCHWISSIAFHLKGRYDVLYHTPALLSTTSMHFSAKNRFILRETCALGAFVCRVNVYHPRRARAARGCRARKILDDTLRTFECARCRASKDGTSKERDIFLVARGTCAAFELVFPILLVQRKTAFLTFWITKPFSIFNGKFTPTIVLCNFINIWAKERKFCKFEQDK